MRIHVLSALSDNDSAGPFQHLFDPDVHVIQEWLRHAGHTVVDRGESCDLTVVFCCVVCSTPYIAVATEQVAHVTHATASSRDFFARAAMVWCMDMPDWHHLRDIYHIPADRLVLAPATIGGWKQHFVPRPVTLKNYVLHFGTLNDRRRTGLININTRAHTIHTNLFPSQELADFIYHASAVVVINYYPPPCMYTLHRLAFVFRNRGPTTHVIAEECPQSTYIASLLEGIPRWHTCSYDALPDVVAASVVPQETAEDDTITEARFDALLHFTPPLPSLTE